MTTSKEEVGATLCMLWLKACVVHRPQYQAALTKYVVSKIIVAMHTPLSILVLTQKVFICSISHSTIEECSQATFQENQNKKGCGVNI